VVKVDASWKEWQNLQLFLVLEADLEVNYPKEKRYLQVLYEAIDPVRFWKPFLW
jgi:Fe-S cluster biosynthesis and repair protein YggX